MFRNLSEMWKFRNLIIALVRKHLSARYRGSFLGFLWSFLNPLLLLAVYSFVFQYYMRFEGVENYSLFLFVGLLPWIWFSSGILEATSSISSGGNLITKAIFPAHVLPMVSVFTNLANFLLAMPVLLLFMLGTGVYPSFKLVLWFPVIVFIELIFLSGLSLMFSALNVRYRDIQHILANFLTLWFFLSPILYPVENVPEQFRFSLFFNPVAQFTLMYHAVFLEGAHPPMSALLNVSLSACLVFVLGNYIFNRCRDGFAELV